MATALVAIFALLLVSGYATTEKRSVQATTCDAVHAIDIDLCSSASEGTFCLTAAESTDNGNMPNSNICGCHLDDDCFTSAVYPYCVKNGKPYQTGPGIPTLTEGGPGICDACTELIPDLANRKTFTADHLFCRNRFPSGYLLAPPPGFESRSNEQVPPTSNAYFREVCNRNAMNGGACEGCHQASETNTPDQDFPSYPSGFSAASLRGAKGSIHCRHVYPGGAGSPSSGEARPICSYVTLFDNAGIGPGTSAAPNPNNLWSVGTIRLNIAKALVDGVVTPDVFEDRTALQWQGACIPCVIGGTPRHALCAVTNPAAPICSAAGCSPCTSNTQCNVDETACKTSGTCTDGSTTPAVRGGNCMASGACVSCKSDSDCGLGKDGGETPNQEVCNLVTGQCEDLKPCASNQDCTAGTNCMLDGKCRACTTGTDCITNDGPGLLVVGRSGKANQPTCNVATGVCLDCTSNAECSGSGNANCQKDGTCLNCGSTVIGNPNCLLDGGEKADQPICDPIANICIDACTDNSDCTSRVGADDAFTRGKNCQKDGTCHTCTGNADCGSKDGPSIPDQTTCQTTPGSPGLGQCYNPFTCMTNAQCAQAVPQQPANCQADQTCANCAVSKQNSNCGLNKDGGEKKDQPNCDLATLLCVDACNDNDDCVGTQGKNCMKNGVCFDCEGDADCAATAPWQGDFDNERVCDLTSKLCMPACTSNNDCPDNTNCMDDGHCRKCTNDADCVSNDGPPPQGSNTVCKANGVCGDPFTCDATTDNAGCKAQTGRNNCQADGTCLTCTSNTDCFGKDGGATPNQPRCDLATGTCVACQTNADCPTSDANCGKDGRCYDCNDIGNTCGGMDGGEIVNQPNCNPRDGICTFFCTKDDQCEDQCNPFCHLDTGCCVECLNDNHCPYSHWVAAAAERTDCDGVLGMCVPPREPVIVFPTCATDDDCGGDTPACSLAEQRCVECLFDSHCGGETPACSTSQQNCVECVFDDHCGVDEECGSDHECHDDSDAAASLSILSASLILGFTTLVAL